jgi:chromosome segregation ATPase
MLDLENNNEKLMKELKITQEKLKYLQRSKKELEIDIDIVNAKLREKDYENNQLTEYYHGALEDLAITCSELDNLKDHNAETTQRLKDQLRELNNELEMIHQNKGRRSGRAHTVTDIIMQEPKLKNSLIGKCSFDMIDTILGSLNNRLKSYQN